MMIIDASVAVPWLIETPFSASARRLRSTTGRAPSLLLIETTNSLLKYLRAGQLSTAEIALAINALPVALAEIVADMALLPAATDIAARHDHNIHDCLYLALALERREPLATADKRMATLAQKLSIETELIEPTL